MQAAQISRSDADTPKDLFPAIKSAGTISPMSTPPTYQGQDCLRNSIMFIGLGKVRKFLKKGKITAFILTFFAFFSAFRTAGIRAIRSSLAFPLPFVRDSFARAPQKATVGTA